MRRGLVLLAVALCLHTSSADALYLSPAYNGKINNLIAGVIAQDAVASGETTAGSVALTNTYSAVSGVIGSVAIAGAGVLVASTPVGWAGVLGELAIQAGVSGAIALAIDGTYNWLFSGSTVTDGIAQTAAGAAITAGTPVYLTDQCNTNRYGSNTGDLFAACLADGNTAVHSINVTCTFVGNTTPSSNNTIFIQNYTCKYNSNGSTYTSGYYRATLQSALSTVSCPGGSVTTSLTTCANAFFPAGPWPASVQSPFKLGQAIPASEGSVNADPGLLATAINQAWYQASLQPGYTGVPYVSTNPVTSSQVQQWQAGQTLQAPVTVSDLAAPVSSPGTVVAGSPNTLSGAVTVPSFGTSTGTNTGSGGTQTGGGGITINTCGAAGQPPCEVDWGSASPPPPPTFTPPTWASAIGDNIFNNFNSLTSWQPPSHSGACPQPSFSVFGQSYTISTHCTLIEQNRSAIFTAFHIAWILTGLFILLTA